MRICITTAGGAGTPSEASVYAHFGSAPYFIVFDTEQNAFQVVENAGKKHTHGACDPFQSLAEHSVDALVTGGIGQRALVMLREHHIKAYRASEEQTAAEAVASLQAGRLKEITLDDACAQHRDHHG
jgi:predicted Fe-Mo cluster-binding NifX family protein